MVGTAKLAGFPDTSTPDAYDVTGVKNSDASLRLSLTFSQTPAFDDSIQNTVTIANLGARYKQQGPNVVKLDSDGACFAQWAYPTSAGYFDAVCRVMNANQKKMICAVTDRLTNSTLGADWQAYNGRVVYYTAYTRQ